MFYIHQNLEDKTSQFHLCLYTSHFYLLQGKDDSANQHTRVSMITVHPWPPDWGWSTGQLMFYVTPDLPEVCQCIYQKSLSFHWLLAHFITHHPWLIATAVWGIICWAQNIIHIYVLYPESPCPAHILALVLVWSSFSQMIYDTVHSSPHFSQHCSLFVYGLWSIFNICTLRGLTLDFPGFNLHCFTSLLIFHTLWLVQLYRCFPCT